MKLFYLKIMSIYLHSFGFKFRKKIKDWLEVLEVLCASFSTSENLTDSIGEPPFFLSINHKSLLAPIIFR